MTRCSCFSPYKIFKRLFDIIIVIFGGIFLIAPGILVAVAIKLTSSGPVLYWSKRVGKDNHIFLMPKFRTMLLNTPQVATHLLSDSSKFLTPIGSFLRKSSLDEIPQLLSILRGDMSLVGPRPALYNQDDLVACRDENGVSHLVPGLTGWAQINGRDELSIVDKVKLDTEYLHRASILFDFKIIILTFFKVIRRESVSH